MKSRLFILPFVLFVTFIGVTAHSYAQADNENRKETQSGEIKVTADMVPSLFFTYWQHQAISDAKNSRGVTRPPTAAELRAIESQEDFVPDPGPREIALGGILYKSEVDWVIWINDQRVTPNAVPEEALDLQVFDNYIELKWIDNLTNKIYPIKLRPHQRFDLDNRVFITGEHRE